MGACHAKRASCNNVYKVHIQKNVRLFLKPCCEEHLLKIEMSPVLKGEKQSPS